MTLRMTLTFGCLCSAGSDDLLGEALKGFMHTKRGVSMTPEQLANYFNNKRLKLVFKIQIVNQP